MNEGRDEDEKEPAGVARVTRGGWLLSDPLRVRALRELAREPLMVSELTARLGAPQPRVSSHLAALREAAWVEAVSEGRQRRYRLATPRIGEVMDALAALPGEPPVVSAPAHIARPPETATPIRTARTCYDHLAGVAGVTLCDVLLDRGWLEPLMGSTGAFQPGYALTARGRAELAGRGVAIPAATPGQRRFAYACPDWTERRPHVGGALGAAMLRRLEALGFVERLASTRAVRVAPDWRAWLDEPPRA